MPSQKEIFFESAIVPGKHDCPKAFPKRKYGKKLLHAYYFSYIEVLPLQSWQSPNNGMLAAIFLCFHWQNTK